MIIVDKLIAYGQPPKPGAERYFGNGKKSCHMSCDGDLEELHKFAEKIGLRREWFQNSRTLPHYDLTPNKRLIAVNNGAVEMDNIDQLNAWRVPQGLERIAKGRPPVFGEVNPRDYQPKLMRNGCLLRVNEPATEKTE